MGAKKGNTTRDKRGQGLLREVSDKKLERVKSGVKDKKAMMA